MELLQVLTKKHWLAVDIAKVGQGSTTMYVDSLCVVRVIDEQGEAIWRLHETIHNATKHINIMSTTIGDKIQDLHSMVKYM